MSADHTVDLSQLPGAEDDPSAGPTMYAVIFGFVLLFTTILFLQGMVYDFAGAEDQAKQGEVRELRELREKQRAQLGKIDQGIDRVVEQSRR